MSLKRKNILITGGLGFIGSYLATELRREGANVITIDAQDEDAIDIRDWNKVRDFGSKLSELDTVYHLAALMFVPYAFENPKVVYEVNILGTLNILELCRLKNVNKLIFASSYVYGHPVYLPVDEEHPVNPTNPYARSKVIGEALCKAYHDDFGLNCVILRMFNVYGEGQHDKYLIPSVFKQIVTGRIELMDPEPRRDFLYISDAVEAYINAGEYNKSNFDVFNIGYGVSYSVDNIVKRTTETWGGEIKITYTHLRRKQEIMDVVADIRKAKAELGWNPKVSLEEGINRCAEWYKAQQNQAI
jgi:UDP-glucose 4-epimerase